MFLWVRRRDRLESWLDLCGLVAAPVLSELPEVAKRRTESFFLLDHLLVAKSVYSKSLDT